MTLSFTADRSGYAADTVTANPSSKGDDFAFTPDDGVFHWLARLQENGGAGRDYFSYEPLSAHPVAVTLTLNDYVRFDAPGDYTLHVTTHRVRDAAMNSAGWS